MHEVSLYSHRGSALSSLDPSLTPRPLALHSRERQYSSDFYSHEIQVVVLGYIRPELDYVSKGALPSSLEWLSSRRFGFASAAPPVVPSASWLVGSIWREDGWSGPSGVTPSKVQWIGAGASTRRADRARAVRRLDLECSATSDPPGWPRGVR
jgi:hypothetical protein